MQCAIYKGLAMVLLMAFASTSVATAQDRQFGSQSQFATIDFPASTFTQATGVNAQGQIVGWYIDNNLGIHGFMLSNGHFHRIDPPGSVQTTVSGINDRGEITGTFLDIERETGRGFLLYRGHFTAIDFPGAMQTAALGLNNRSEIVGFYVDENGDVHAYMLGEAGFSKIPAVPVPAGINDRGDIIAGIFGLLSHGHLTTILFPGSVFTEGNGINDRGDIVGDFGDGHAEHGFLLRRGRFTQIDVPGATLTQPMGINASGEIVGYYIAGGVIHGFLRAGARVTAP